MSPFPHVMHPAEPITGLMASWSSIQNLKETPKEKSGVSILLGLTSSYFSRFMDFVINSIKKKPLDLIVPSRFSYRFFPMQFSQTA